MNKFKGFLICTDCDGTLTYEAGKVSEENAKAIRYFQEEGGIFTLATGRFPGHAREFAKQIQVNAPIVALGGTILYDLKSGKTLKEWTANKSDCYMLLQYIFENWPQIWECFINYGSESSTSFRSNEYSSDKKNLEKMFDTFPDKLYKILSFQSADLTKELQADLTKQFSGQFRFDRSWPEGLEIQSKHSGKGVAVSYLKDFLNSHRNNIEYQRSSIEYQKSSISSDITNIHTVVCVGDYENDISMLKSADIAYAVDNALDSVKAVADKITVSNREHALAHIIDDLEKGIKG